MADPIQIFEHEDIPETDITHVTFKVKKIVSADDIWQMGIELFTLVSQGKKKLLVDFGNIYYFSWVGLGKFITLQRMIREANGKLVLCAINSDVMHAFKATQSNRTFHCSSRNLTDGIAVFN